GQKPLALFITCAASRISPDLLAQTQPGELFHLRNAGNIVPPYGTVHGGEDATIEFAVNYLRLRDIILCGHAKCGAMHGLLEPQDLAAVPAVAKRVVNRKQPCPGTKDGTQEAGRPQADGRTALLLPEHL